MPINGNWTVIYALFQTFEESVPIPPDYTARIY